VGVTTTKTTNRETLFAVSRAPIAHPYVQLAGKLARAFSVGRSGSVGAVGPKSDIRFAVRSVTVAHAHSGDVRCLSERPTVVRIRVVTRIIGLTKKRVLRTFIRTGRCFPKLFSPLLNFRLSRRRPPPTPYPSDKFLKNHRVIVIIGRLVKAKNKTL